MQFIPYFKKTLSYLFVASAFICCTDQSATSQTISESENKKNTVIAKPNLGVPVPELRLADDVKKYIRTLLEAPLPADYVLPPDILASNSYDECVSLVNIHYPQFVNLENDDLLRAVRDNPMIYQEMMLEARSVREKFFPGSQPKRNN